MGSDSDSDTDSAGSLGNKYAVQDTNARIVYHVKTGIPENHTLSSDTSPYSKYRGVPPHPRELAGWKHGFMGLFWNRSNNFDQGWRSKFLIRHVSNLPALPLSYNNVNCRSRVINQANWALAFYGPSHNEDQHMQIFMARNPCQNSKSTFFIQWLNIRILTLSPPAISSRKMPWTPTIIRHAHQNWVFYFKFSFTREEAFLNKITPIYSDKLSFNCCSCHAEMFIFQGDRAFQTSEIAHFAARIKFLVHKI